MNTNKQLLLTALFLLLFRVSFSESDKSDGESSKNINEKADDALQDTNKSQLENSTIKLEANITTVVSTDATTTDTTPKPILEDQPQRVGCFVGNTRYINGQFMPGVGSECQVCYCLGGRQQCSDVQCQPPVKGCKPIKKEGQCCPEKYECGENQGDSSNKKIAKNDDVINSFSSRAVLGSKLESLEELANYVRNERESVGSSTGSLDESLVTTEISVANLIEEGTTINQPHPIKDKLPQEIDTPKEIPNREKPSATGVGTFKILGSVHEENLKSRAGSVDIDAIANSVPEDENKIKDDINGDHFGLPEINIGVKNAEGSNDEVLVESTPIKPTESHSKQDELITKNHDSVTDLPFMSISDLLQKIRTTSLRNKNVDSEVVANPPPLDINEEAVVSSDYISTYEGQDENVVDYPSYDIDVGTSLIAGSPDLEPVGVGQVIPVDLQYDTDPLKSSNSPSILPSTTTSTVKPQPSFLDTFLNLLAGSASKKRPNSKPGLTMTPASLRPPPIPGMRAPPRRGNKPEDNDLVENELQLIGNHDKIILTKPNSIVEQTEGRVPENDLSIPALPAIRKPPFSLPPINTNNMEIKGMKAPGNIFHKSEPTPIRKKPINTIIDPSSLPKVNEKSDDNLLTNSNIVSGQRPPLPPLLPNLQIIPFMASDAVVNQDSFLSETNSLAATRPIGSCQEQNRIWRNGEKIDRGDKNPCILCRCHYGKVVCQVQECPKVPEGCTSEDLPAENECCAKITCDTSLNISIIDTLPSFKPIERKSDELPNPVRASAFAHHNRRPPFAPASRRPKPAKPLSELRKSFIGPHKRRPVVIPSSRKDEVDTTKNDNVRKSPPKRPQRPILPRPSIDRFTNERKELPVLDHSPVINKTPSIREETISIQESKRPTSEDEDHPRPPPFNSKRPRPFSQFRTGTRRPFIPPRIRPAIQKRPSNDFIAPISKFASTAPLPIEKTEASIIPEEKVTSVAASVIPVSGTVTFAKDDVDLPPPPKVRPRPFNNLFELLSKNKSSLPKPLHNEKPTIAEDIIPKPEKPFILPPDLLLPKPITPSRLPINENLLNVVQIEKVAEPGNEIVPEGEFNVQTPKTILHPFQSPAKPLPEIPEFVKAQLPLGNDPILVSGLLELAGCNVYGRMFEIGEKIKDISGKCKVCQCTKVGVQCLPIC